MNKKQIKAIVKGQLAIVITATKDATISKWKRSKAVYDMTQMVNWSKTPYGSFSEFIRQEMRGFKPGVVMLWKHEYKAIHEDLGYSWPAIQAIGKAISYNRANAYVRLLKETANLRKQRPQIKSFIQGAKATVSMDKVRVGNNSQINGVSLALSDKHMRKLEVLLEPHGFVKTTKGVRLNISRVFERWLDTL